jgi:hypothetical protein
LTRSAHSLRHMISVLFHLGKTYIQDHSIFQVQTAMPLASNMETLLCSAFREEGRHQYGHQHTE